MAAVLVASLAVAAPAQAAKRCGEPGSRWQRATPRQAVRDIARTAAGEALLPAIDQTRTVGLVTLPGAFVGALFGGASPGNAARFQLVVLVGLLAAEGIAAVTLTWLLGAPSPLPLAPVEPTPAQTRLLRLPRRRTVG